MLIGMTLRISVQILSNNILKLSRSFSSISTVSRGGLIPSRLLADVPWISQKYLLIKKIFPPILYL